VSVHLAVPALVDVLQHIQDLQTERNPPVRYATMPLDFHFAPGFPLCPWISTAQLRGKQTVSKGHQRELRNVSLELRNVSSELRNVSLELRNVSSEMSVPN
jgi:hypothetical protein